ncbi:MAG: hypothetical protein H6733_13775 [Alphaproteobacteria bacterium]|nr:hypothetical protein [Alphaproteobacteria bacterium]
MRALWMGCVAAVMAAGCATDDGLQGLPTDQAAPPVAVGTLDFVVGQLVAGDTVRMMWAGLPPGTEVYFAHGNSAAPGPCYPQLQGDCLDVAGGVRLVGTAIANADGYAELNVRVPRSVPSGSRHVFQGVAFDTGGVYQGRSQVFERGEGFTICPLFFSPTCGVDSIDYSNSCFAYAGGSAIWLEGSFCP